MLLLLLVLLLFAVIMAVKTLLCLGVLAVSGVLTGAAMLDPLDLMRDDISRIKVTMESVGGQFHSYWIITKNRSASAAMLLSFNIFHYPGFGAAFQN